MPLFYNQNKSGKGVAKGAPVKKPFFRFFELLGRKFWKLFGLNALYFLLCLPVVTIGPATAALTHVMRKFTLEEPIFVFSEFMSAFKKNFKQSVLMGILDVIFYGAFAYSLYFYGVMLSEEASTQNYLLMALTMISGVFFTAINFYTYPQIVSLNLKLPAIVKNSALLAVIGLKRNFIALAGLVGIVTVFVLLFPYSMLVLPLAPFSWIAFLTVFSIYPVIQRYIINPFYESRGERNPELDAPGTEVPEQSIFTDMGGKEDVIDRKKVKEHGKVIR